MIIRALIGEALFTLAGISAKAARAVIGKPSARLVTQLPAGQRLVQLDRRIPPIAERLKFESPDCVEMPRVVSIRGRAVEIDRPLERSYQAGAAVSVLF